MCAAFAENMISDTPTRVQPQTVHASQNKTTNPSLAAMQLNRVSPTTSLIRTKTLSSSQGTSDQLFPIGQAKKDWPCSYCDRSLASDLLRHRHGVVTGVI